MTSQNPTQDRPRSAPPNSYHRIQLGHAAGAASLVGGTGTNRAKLPAPAQASAQRSVRNGFAATGRGHPHTAPIGGSGQGSSTSRRTPATVSISTSKPTHLLQRDFKTPAFELKGGVGHATISYPRARARRFAFVQPGELRGQDEENEQDEEEGWTDDDDEFDTTTNEENSDDDEMQGVEVVGGVNDSGIAGLDELPLPFVGISEVKHKIRALERGALLNSYNKTLKAATHHYSHVLIDMKKLLKEDLGAEVHAELEAQIGSTVAHRKALVESILRERNDFPERVAGPTMAKAQELINELYDVQAQTIENRKGYDKAVTTARDQAQAKLEAHAKKYQKDQQKLLKKIGSQTTSSASGVGASGPTTKVKGTARANGRR